MAGTAKNGLHELTTKIHIYPWNYCIVVIGSTRYGAVIRILSASALRMIVPDSEISPRIGRLSGKSKLSVRPTDIRPMHRSSWTRMRMLPIIGQLWIRCRCTLVGDARASPAYQPPTYIHTYIYDSLAMSRNVTSHCRYCTQPQRPTERRQEGKRRRQCKAQQAAPSA